MLRPWADGASQSSGRRLRLYPPDRSSVGGLPSGGQQPDCDCASKDGPTATTEHITRSGGDDAASTDGLTESLQALLPALERFLRFGRPDPAARRSACHAQLDETLLEQGEGREAVLGALRDVLIANGLRIGHPGFSGWVTTMPTTIGTVADLAQTVAGAQRWWAYPGNRMDTLAMRWLIDLLGFPASFGDAFATGGSTANLIGIGAARQHAGERLGLRPSLDGLDGLPATPVWPTAGRPAADPALARPARSSGLQFAPHA